MNRSSPFRYFKASPEIIRLAEMTYVRFPLSLRNVEDLLHIPGYPPTYSDNIRPFVPGYPPSFDALP